MNHGLEMCTGTQSSLNHVCIMHIHDRMFLGFPLFHSSIPDVADPKNLMPMYQKLHSAIRQFDDRHVILFEPTIIITSVSYLCVYMHVYMWKIRNIFYILQLPFKNFANTGLTSGPGGTAYNDRYMCSTV